ncbi:hypothetical protein H6G81_15805 [Scytonema hofmannii FACHB-248]|uniref:Uncharacterized protein n=1 Tax=Scytonema hofmannii FACHB-248 TaxID=1842502 RepID=A0ABR8GSC4_9CYAN|nr:MULTISPECIES: hypothetical protein [Nostocales]MBD2605945.1 hypothetical protein [Scytonema hofmannii FACHB-248]
MTLTLKHFDTKLKLDTGVEEKIENSLAEYLYPDVEFAIGTVYPGSTTAQDLEEHEGKTLQFAAGERMYFASDDKVRDSIYPNASDGAAYGSLLFTPCRDFKELKNLRLIVIDDATGENGGFLPLDVAKNLVGDCYGKISLDLAEELTGSSNTPFQFRLGIKEQEKNPVARIAKGTLAPFRLEQVGEALIRDNGKTGYDMVLATSSFKGRKGEDAITPGEYNLTVGLGIKTLAEYGKHSLGTQILVNYPRAVEADMLPRLELDAMILANIQSDPRKIAQHYVETYSLRKAFVNGEGKSKILDFEGDLAEEVESVFSNLGESGELNPEQQQQQDQLIYRLIKADLEGHFQILEHPKIIAELQEFVRASWVDIATGRAIKFNSGLAQPSLKLAENEICVPYIPEGEEIIVTRSPLVNSNGVIVLTNRHLPEVMKLSGTVHINPKTAADNLQADFDGDRLAFAHKRDFPTLAAEVKEYNLPANRYPDVVKKAKVPYQGTFAEIAVSAMENKIGLIANEIQKNVALQWETQLMPKEEEYGYLRRISAHLSNIGAKHKNGEINIPEEILKQITPITKLPASLTTEQIKQGLSEVRNLLRSLVGELSNELQVAVDGPKSALRPDESILKYCQEICNYTSVVWLTDKKNPEAFLNRGMKSTNHSPIDLMVKQTNQHFEENQLIARQLEQFRALYPGVEFTQEHKDQATTIKNTYNGLIKEAIRLEEKRKLEPGPSLIITSATSGRQIEVTNLIKFDTSQNPNLWKATELSIRLEDRKATKDMPQTLAANVTFKDPKTVEKTSQSIGTVSVASVREHNLKAGMTIKQGKVSFQPGVSKSIVEAAFSKASEYLETVRNSTSESEKLPLAAALHNITHTEESHLYQGRKKASVAFAAFPDQIIGQLKELQFTNLSVVGTHQPSSQHNGRNWHGEKVPIKIELDADPRDPNISQRWVIAEGKKLAMFNSESPQLPTGTEAVATITSPPSASVIITSSKGNQLKVGQIKKYAFGDRSFQGESYTISIELKSNSDHRKPPTPLALVNGKALGVIDKDSFAVLSEKVQAANQSIESLKFNATIQSAPATTAHLIIDPATVRYPEEWTNKDAPQEREIIKTELDNKAQGVNTNTHTTQESEIIKTEPLIDTTPAPNERTEPNPTPTIIREKWEQNLINASLKAIRALPHNQNAIIQTATVGSKHTAIYSTSNNTLQIINDQQQVVYQATRDQRATINHLTEKQKSYWQSTTGKNQHSQSER